MKNFRNILLFLFLVSCSSKQTILPTTTPVHPTVLPTETRITPIQATTQTSTVVPTTVPTITNTPAPIWTPLPTFSPTNAVRILHDWVLGTSNCLLPCWGGITPGKTNWQEAQQLLTPLSGFASLKTVENFNCNFGQCNSTGWSLAPETLAEGDFYTNAAGDIVHMIYIDIQNAGSQKTNFTRDIKLRNVLKFYGLPSVLLFNADLTSQYNKYLEITLVYPKRQFVITYWKKVKIEGDKAVSCAGYTHVRVIVLDNQDQLMSLDSIAKGAETKDLDMNNQPKSAQEAIGMTNSAFFKYFRGKSEPCISTPINIWSQ